MANSKLCFLLHKKFFAAENSLPAEGGVKAPPKSVLFDRRLRHERIAICSNRRGDGLISKISIMEKSRPPRKGRGGRPGKDDPAIHRFSVNFSAEEQSRFLTMYELGAVIEGGFYQGTGFRRRVSSDKNRSRNAGIRGQTDATARSIPNRGNELQPGCEAIAHPFLGAESTRHAL